MIAELPADLKGKTFEELLAELDVILRKLESGNLPMAETIVLYERGALLLKQCYSQLGEFEGKVSILVRDAEGALKLNPLQDDEARNGLAR